MRLSNPQKASLGDRLERDARDVVTTLAQMDRSVDKAAADPVRFGLTPPALAARRQWVADARAHLQSIAQALAQSATDGASGAAPGNAELAGAVRSHQQQQQLVVVQQDEMLDHIAAAAGRIGQMGLAMNQELKVPRVGGWGEKMGVDGCCARVLL